MSRRDFIHCAKTLQGIVAASVLVLGVSACHRQVLPEPSLQSVRTTAVEAIAAESGNRYSAVITPFAQVDLGFKSPGIVAGIRQVRGADGQVRSVGAGDRVGKGADLAHVRTTDYQQGVSQAEAQLVQAKAQIADATASYEIAKQNWDRSQALFQSGSLIKPQYDAAKSAFDSAQAKVSAADAAFSGAGAGLTLTRLGLADTVIHAPFTGWITARNVDMGTLAGTGTVAFSMVDTHLVKASFAVPDRALASVRLGGQQEVQLDSLPHPVRGTITAISQQADAKTHVFTVEITVPNAEDAIRPGMICSLRLKSPDTGISHLVVPLSAVVRPLSTTDRFAVFVLETRDGKTFVRSNPIAVGDTYGDSVEVLSGGLVEGERIVSTGASLLQNTQQVRVLP